MKKLLICLLTLMLMTATALAEAKVEKSTKVGGNVTICTATNCYIDRGEDGYHLYDAYGNVLSAAYDYLSPYNYGEYIEVQYYDAVDPRNCYGLLNAAGQEVLPEGYADFYYLDNGWVLAYVLEPTDAEVGEYKDNDGNQYLIARTDVVCNGAVIGSLGREDYIHSYRVGAKGQYMYVRTANNHLYWLDSSFNRVDVFDDDYVSTAEFDNFYSTKNVRHNPTQQDAFVAGCTLTEDQVEQSVWYDSANKRLVDLQGNVLAENVSYDSAYNRGGYLEVRSNGLNGILSRDGKEIIPPMYKDIAYATGMKVFQSGYNAVLDEKGRLSYYDTNGNVTASVDYELNSSDYKGYSFGAPIVVVNNMGKYIVITATHGELPTKYEDFSNGGAKRTVITVKKDGKWGVIDMAGNTVVPFDHEYSLTISADGTLAYGRTDFYNGMLYNISYGEDGTAAAETVTEPAQTEENAEATPAPAADGWICVCGSVNTGKFCGECGSAKPTPTPEPTATPTPTPTPTPDPTATPAPTEAPTATPAPVDDGSWICACGSVNTGKFCGECGSAMPTATPAPTEAPVVDDGSWDCACGSHNTGKFCPECGSAKPAAEPQCANCGYKPEGAAPKFCPECGTKF